MDKNLGQLLESMPTDQRITRYRQFAQEALREAALEKNINLRAGYISMASGWYTLAGEVERNADRHGAVQVAFPAELAPKRD